MRSIAALGRVNSFSLHRLLRREAIERIRFGAKIFLIACCVLVAAWALKTGVRDIFASSSATTKLSNEITRMLATIKESPAVQRKTLDYSKIANQQMFGKIGAPQVTAPPAVQPPPVSNVSLKLIGTYVATGQDPTAIIEDSKKPGSQDVFGIGDNIFDEAKLVAVLPDRAEIDRAGKREVLMLDDAPSGSGDAGEAGGNTIVVDEGELDNALANLPMLLTQARAVPYFKDGKSVGLRLFAIRRGSLFEKIGLQNGDILKEINGQSLSDITQAVKLFEKLKEQRDIAVSLERQREEQSYRYLIR